MIDKFLKANDPDYDMCKKCVGTGIMEVGIAAAKRVCNGCNGEGYVKKMSKTKIDGLIIKCGEKSLWVSREAVEDMLNGKRSDSTGRDITVAPHVVKVGQVS